MSKGLFGLPRFPLIFLFMKFKGANFAGGLITLSNRFYKNFCQKGLIIQKNGKTGFFCFP